MRSSSSSRHPISRSSDPGKGARASARLALLPPFILACWLGLVAGACATGNAGTVRFRNEPIVWRVDDRRDVPRPETPIGGFKAYTFDAYYTPIHWVLGVPTPERARDVNAVGEVPDSTWFENRIGRRSLHPEDVRRGPTIDDGPVGRWTVLRSKTEGTGPGLFVEDERGVRYLVKFDPVHQPDVETAAHVITQRLLWAVGYHVPEDDIAYFERADLRLADGATKEVNGEKVPMTEEDLDELLSRVSTGPDGRLRALVSKFLAGEPVGTSSPHGVRHDDVNDRIPHEHRRSLRGQYVFFGWLGHTDLHLGNRLDMWIEDPDHPGQHHLVHYLLDFGRAMGVMAWKANDPADAYAHMFDYRYSMASAFTLGLWKRPWEGVHGPDIPGVARLESENFDPGGFHPRQGYYAPFLWFDDEDGFWAAKIMMALTPELIAAAVEAGDYGDPRATEYVTRTLIERQRKSARYWFSRTNPLDAFEVHEGNGGVVMCARDLLLHHGLYPEAIHSRYHARAYDERGAAIPWKRSVTPKVDGRVCLDGVRLGGAEDHYTIVRIDGVRDERAVEPVLVHVARAPETGKLRVIGLWRGEP